MTKAETKTNTQANSQGCSQSNHQGSSGGDSATALNRPFNFSAGPGALPEEVLEIAKEEMLDWHGSGMSIMEVSHRGKEFGQIAEQSQADLRELLDIPSNYKILFLQGGATSQFSMVPFNLLRGNTSADYVNTGFWSERAIAEANKYCQVNVVASGEADKFTTIPDGHSWQLSKDSAYLHYTANETIHGVEFHYTPQSLNAKEIPLVTDMSSNMLSRPFDVSKFGLIYAGAQKNIGPAGLTIVIVRDDLIGQVDSKAPTLFDYQNLAKTDSMANTPPTYSWYMAGLVLKWLKKNGGLTAMAETNKKKAELLYSTIDQSDFYHNSVAPECRSLMNIPFILKDTALDKTFLDEAKRANLLGLAGHRAVGGMRASLYNAVTIEAVQALTNFMTDFAKRHG
ncbi:3-phosphoserine/phosphohydroxythreonine transaminase [bacterium]|nr:3-phosphoserine/phosphohydroxythreonine transaminase [bacterium]MBP9807601.1 3-phosphoserine/phosphohydroxythreonine transaminase [bacterium]